MNTVSVSCRVTTSRETAENVDKSWNGNKDVAVLLSLLKVIERRVHVNDNSNTCRII